ncbi:hypothetical protein CKAN_02613300 [Cinnamomum micranthum f. kanehirae]|uniref:Uncharacterized protein n=1 Tax=Cinnamomum micranthum f. kanehirae TaxID=337451 RepID=A0A443Q123_9MAGN|nr:hypothetical protein CKAN_02613300 [Cinnamomum micranthum f. kanehirae]
MTSFSVLKLQLHVLHLSLSREAYVHCFMYTNVLSAIANRKSFSADDDTETLPNNINNHASSSTEQIGSKEICEVDELYEYRMLVFLCLANLWVKQNSGYIELQFLIYFRMNHGCVAGRAEAKNRKKEKTGRNPPGPINRSLSPIDRTINASNYLGGPIDRMHCSIDRTGAKEFRESLLFPI